MWNVCLNSNIEINVRRTNKQMRDNKMVDNKKRQQDKINSQLKRTINQNKSNFYTIAEIQVNKAGDKITVCGTLPGVRCGEVLEITGEWVTHEKHGLQFNIIKFESKLPADVKGIMRYLGSGLVDGIGKIYAKKIVDHFGAETFNVLSNESARLMEIDGIGESRAKKIKEAWESQFAIRDIMIFLQTYGVSNSLCVKLYEKYGNEARTILETNPYRVCQEVSGIGFKTADTIAKNIGLPTTHPSRIDAGIFYVLSTFEDEGNTCMPRQLLIKHTQILLELSPDKINEQIENMISFGKLCIIGNDIIQKTSLRKTESSIERSLQNIVFDKKSSLPDIWVEKAVEWVQKHESLAFEPEQIDALISALTNKVSVLTGWPGTGKTTILRALVSILSAKKVNVVLCAPTGRAAQKLSEAAGRPASTIHRLLQYNSSENRFAHNEETPLKLDFIIIDESSMIDTFLASSLLKAIPTQAHVLFVGDTDQLPSVGPGNVLGDIIKSKKFPVTQLRRIFRQGKCSEIISVAHDIVNSVETFPKCSKSFAEIDPTHDFNFIESTDADDCLQKITELCNTHLQKWYNVDPLNDVQILVPVHKGTIGTENINNVLQDIFVDKQFGVEWTKFRIGDKVMQTKNNYEKNIFNGDLGKVIYLNDDERTATIQFNDDTVVLNNSALCDLTLAYAISIHKSQGSEFPVVIIALLRQHYIMLQRNLLYTAITRGRNKVFIIGDPDSYALASHNKERANRMTGLYSNSR